MDTKAFVVKAIVAIVVTVPSSTALYSKFHHPLLASAACIIDRSIWVVKSFDFAKIKCQAVSAIMVTVQANAFEASEVTITAADQSFVYIDSN